MRIDCNHRDGDHRCCLAPGHDELFHLCDGCKHSWPNDETGLEQQLLTN